MTLLKTLFSFYGRISRRTYWIISVCWLIGLFIVQVLTGVDALGADSAAERAAQNADVDPAAVNLFLLFVVFMAWSTFAIAAKRWHDIDRTGWWALINIVPLGVLVSLVVNGFFRGTQGENRFGADPLEVDRNPLVIDSSSQM